LAGGAEWSFLDAFYMAVITATTVGYEEVHPLNAVGRMAAVLVMLGGVGTFLYALSSITEVVVESHVLRHRRLARKVRRLKNHFIICGLGRVGEAIRDELKAQGAPYAVISLEEPPLDADDPIIVGDATNDETLLKAGIERARGLVAVLGTDADNIYTVLAARSLRPDLLIVARCSEDRSVKKMLAAGANRVINPYERGGMIMAQVLMRPRVVDFLEEVGRGTNYSVSFEEIEVGAGSSLIGQTLRDSPIRRELDVIVTAIRKADGRTIFNPAPEQRIESGDILIVMGNPGGLDRLGALARTGTAERVRARAARGPAEAGR
ncbi:MAG: potassium channel protein, partial [Acidobacteria bacterium]